MKSSTIGRLTTILMVTCITSVVAAAPLLGGGGGGGLLSVDGGSAGSDSTVNVGVGSGGGSSPGNVLDINVLGNGTNSAGNVNLSSGGTGGSNGGLLDADIDLLGGGGQVGDVDIDIGGNDGIGICVDVFGDCGGSGGTGGAGGFDVAGLGAGIGAICVTADDRRALTLVSMGGYSASTYASWARANDVEVIVVRPCPELKARITAALAGSPAAATMQQAVRNDALISATLARNSHDAGDVLAVLQRGNTVNVFVF